MLRRILLASALALGLSSAAMAQTGGTGNAATAPLTPVAPAAATAVKGWLFGLQYNSTQPTFSNGQQGSAQASSRGALIVAPGAEGFAVTGTFALPSNAAQETGGNLATISTNTGTANTNLGAPGATACATDTGSCSANSLLQRIAQRITSLISAIGTPFQAGGGLGASTATIGNVGGKSVSICVTPTVTVTNSYGINFVVGGKLTFANAFTAAGSGILQNVVVTINKVETSGFTFYPFASDPSATTWTDAAVAAINATDVPKVRGPVGLNLSSGLGTHTIGYAYGLGHLLVPGTTTLYGVLISNAALTNQFSSTSDVQVCVKTMQDLG